MFYGSKSHEPILLHLATIPEFVILLPVNLRKFMRHGLAREQGL